ncbi:MAG TPA: hypothetical protein ACFYD3_11450 [Candidatus Hypogeohydataceae bacterium YC41]
MFGTAKEEKGKEVVSPKYASLRIGLRIIVVFSYVMLGISIIFFILGMIGIGVPPLLVFLPTSFLLALFAFGILMQVRVVQLQQDIELNTRRMADLLHGFSKQPIVKQ